MAIRDVEWDACVLEPRHDRDLEAYMRRELGAVPSAVPYFSVSPWIVRAMTTMSYYGAPLVHIDHALAGLVGLVVSQDNSCRYCFGVQRTLMRVHGLPGARIRQIEHDFLEAEIEPRTKAALDFARRVSRAAPLVSGADAAPLLEHGFSPVAIKELAFQAGYNVFMNRLMTVPAIPVASVERAAQHWALGWVAPFARLAMRRRWRPGGVTVLPPGFASGPWSPIVRALDGLPAARVLRTSIDEALASEVLPRRAKALIFAVVARGLDCGWGCEEATRLLEETGLTPDQIESILMHLGSPDLDPVESAIVPFARGTIRGRPVQLQQQGRALFQRLRPEQVAEAIGTSALANAICRLGVVTQLG